MIPEKIGRYQISGELGKGAMGVVYMAIDPNIGRPVALKTMRVDVHGSESEDMARRFRNEARAAGVLNHRNIVTIYDAGEDNSIFYIAMEYIEGTTLAALLNERRCLPLDQVVDIGTQICAGLEYAHPRGVIHRDIKPTNVMLTPDGDVKIMDFGIAKAGSGMTSTGEVLGTPNYMSPEQVRGRLVDGRSDLFSTGVILYEMTTGEKPFSGQNVTTIMYKIVHENPIAPRELDVAVHPGLSAVIVRSLAKSADERYQTGAQMAEALRNYKTLDPAAEQTLVFGSGAYVSQPATGKTPAVQPPTGANMTPRPGTDGSKKLGTSARKAAATPPPSKVPIAHDPDQTVDSSLSLKKAAPQAPKVSMPKIDLAPLIANMKRAAGSMQESMTPVLASIPGLMKKRQVQAGLGAVAVLIIAFLGVRAARNRRAPEPAPTQAVVPAATQPETPAAPATAAPDATAPAEVPTDTAAVPTPPERPSTSGPSEAQKARAQASKAVEQAKALAAQQQKNALDEIAKAASAGTTVTVNSSPLGAKVEIDGRSVAGWVTPLTTTELKPGKHSVTISMNGYKPYTTSVDVIAGKHTPIDAALTTTQAVVHIVSKPAGADISLDGKPTGLKSPAQITIEPGQHKILLSKPGFRDVESIADAASGQDLQIEPTLTEVAQAAPGSEGNPFRKIGRIFGSGGGIPANMGQVEIRTKPKAAKVTINDHAIERETPVRVPLNPGTYKVDITLDGFKPLSKTVQIEKGKSLTLDETLEKQ